MNPLKKLAGQTALYGLSSVVGRFLNYLLFPLYTNIFLPKEYGVVTEFYAYVGFLVVLLTYGMETAFFRFSTGDNSANAENNYSTGLWSLIGSSSLFLFITLIYSQEIANFLEYPQNPEYIKYFAWILAMDAVCSLPFARLRLQNKALKFASIKLLNISINIGANLFFLLFLPFCIKQNILPVLHELYNPEIGVGYIFISNLLASAITFLMLLPLFAPIKNGWDTVQWKTMLKYALPLIIVGLAGIANEMADRIMLKQLLPFDFDKRMSMIGIYGANYKIAMLMTIMVQAFRYAAEPFFFNKSGDHDAKKLYVQVLDFFVLFGCTAFLVVLFYIDIIQHLIGVNYRSGLSVVPILLMANLFLGMQVNISIWYKLTGKTKIGAAIALFTAVITIILNFLFIPHFYYLGSAWATLIAYAFMVLMTALIGHKYYPVPYHWKKISLYILTALALYLMSANLELLLQPETAVKLIINTLLLLPFFFLIWILERKYKP